jgi:CRISPR/Cas system type I-B associated protein Csh2 (Cas7 group RAMP superfamily)
MNRFILFLILLGLVFVFAQIVVKSNTDSVAMNKYEVIAKFKGFEIRQYEELFVAKTKMNSADYENNSSTGFRRIAGYIFGSNESNQKIAMTSPVIMDMSDSVEMAFIMPDNITEANAPSPADSRVILEKRPSKTIAVLTFGGWANTKKLAQKEKALIKLLNDHDISYFGDAIFMGYNPPYQVIDRKNEIAIEVNYIQ